MAAKSQWCATTQRTPKPNTSGLSGIFFRGMNVTFVNRWRTVALGRSWNAYGGLHPVTFGHCGYPGLCVRGIARSFCLGCLFLVRRPEYLDPVDFLLEGYLPAADAHERMGDLAGARERKRL